MLSFTSPCCVRFLSSFLLTLNNILSLILPVPQKRCNLLRQRSSTAIYPARKIALNKDEIIEIFLAVGAEADVGTEDDTASLHEREISPSMFTEAILRCALQCYKSVRKSNIQARKEAIKQERMETGRPFRQTMRLFIVPPQCVSS